MQFTFTPLAGRLECSAFSAPFKALAVTLVTAAIVWGWQLRTQGLLEPNWRASAWLVATLGLMVYTEWHILKGRTTLDASALQQSWVWHKRTPLDELAYAKLIRIRGLEWLIAPRLYTKTYSGKLTLYYACAPAMLNEFERLERALQRFRNARSEAANPAQ